MSTYSLLGIPEAAGLVLLTLGLILVLAPYAGGVNFGIFEVPVFSPHTNAVLRWVGPVGLAASIVLFLPLWPKPSPDPDQSARDRALILGYDSAFALANAIRGKLTNQERAVLAEHLRLLGLDKVRFPDDPHGSGKDAAPAAEYAREVAGILIARSTAQQRAFLLGWFGVICSSTPDVCPDGFSIRNFAQEAGFKNESKVPEPELLERLVALARKSTTP